MLLEQRAALAFGHATPDAEFDAVIKSIGATFQDHRAVSADDGGLALGSAADEELIGIGLPASSLGYPGNPSLGLRAVDNAVCWHVRCCPPRRGPRT